ncbi:MAG: LysR substrate-binding domain-containing protein [Burkholderiaceae bacterium]|nr:LysR substrate-binding domain-containing protein [Burkholderiaceae bacterium]
MTTRRRSTLDRTPPRGPDANALEYFARVAAAGSFAEAARQLGQTRAAVSRRIAQIEAQVGAPLFARSTRALGLSDTGRRLVVRARAVLEAADAARRGLRARGDALAGTLRLSSVPMFGQAVLGPLLAAFQARHPQLRIEMRLTGRRVDLLREDIDVAFRLTERPPEDCIAQPVLPYVVRAWAAPGPGLPLPRPAALAQQRCLVLGTPADEIPMTWLAERGRGREDITIAPAMVADDMGTLVAVARSGGGVVFAPDFALRDEVAAGRLIDALPGWRLPVPEGQAVQALTLPLAVAPASARALVAFVREALAAEPPR